MSNKNFENQKSLNNDSDDDKKEVDNQILPVPEFRQSRCAVEYLESKNEKQINFVLLTIKTTESHAC